MEFNDLKLVSRLRISTILEARNATLAQSEAITDNHRGSTSLADDEEAASHFEAVKITPFLNRLIHTQLLVDGFQNLCFLMLERTENKVAETIHH